MDCPQSGCFPENADVGGIVSVIVGRNRLIYAAAEVNPSQGPNRPEAGGSPENADIRGSARLFNCSGSYSAPDHGVVSSSFTWIVKRLEGPTYSSWSWIVPFSSR